MKKVLMLLTLTIGLLSCELRDMKLPRKDPEMIGDMMTIAYKSLGDNIDSVKLLMKQKGYEAEGQHIFYVGRNKKTASYVFEFIEEPSSQKVHSVAIYKNYDYNRGQTYSNSEKSIEACCEKFLLFSDALAQQPWDEWKGSFSLYGKTQTFSSRDDYLSYIKEKMKTSGVATEEVKWAGNDEKKSCVLKVYRLACHDFDGIADEDELAEYYQSPIIGFTPGYSVKYLYQLPVKKIWFNTESFSTLLKYDTDLVKIQAQPKLNADYGYFSTIEFSSSDESIFTAEYYQHGSIYIKPRAVGEATLFVEIDGLKAQTQVVVTEK